MANSGALPHGTFCWAELNTTDPEAAREFYARAFGWAARDEPGPPGMPYTKFLLGEDEVAAMIRLMPQLEAAGVPSHWRSYVAVTSADESAEKIAAAGGEILFGPLDAHDKGRMALAKDPQGAPFAIWEAKAHSGATRYNDPGCMCWNELATPDPEAAIAFYGEMFGWGVSKSDTPAGWAYYEWKVGERTGGGMMKIQPEWGPVPPHWNIYFTVGNLAECLENAQAAGGKLIMPPRKIDVGEFAPLNDPQGAGFTVIEMPRDRVDGQPPRVG